MVLSRDSLKSFLCTLMQHAENNEHIRRITSVSIGHGGLTSVSRGARMVKNRPKKLQMPIAVETSCVGKRSTIPK